jgi:hypothetical protein
MHAFVTACILLLNIIDIQTERSAKLEQISDSGAKLEQ